MYALRKKFIKHLSARCCNYAISESVINDLSLMKLSCGCSDIVETLNRDQCLRMKTKEKELITLQSFITIFA